MPLFTSGILQDGNIDDLQNGRPFDLRHENGQQGPADVIGDEGAPAHDVGVRSGGGVASRLREADGRYVRGVANGAVQGQNGHVVSGRGKIF